MALDESAEGRAVAAADEGDQRLVGKRPVIRKSGKLCHEDYLSTRILLGRKPVPMHVVVDEWQLYPSTTIGAMLSQGRKYGLRMRLANQNLAQLSPALRDSVLGNSGSVVCFRVGPADAALLDGLFPTVPRHRLQTLPPHTFAVTFGDRDLVTAAPPPLES